MKRIAIIGATSHIAKGIIYSFLNATDNYLYLFARNKNAVNNFVSSTSTKSDNYLVSTFEDFNNYYYDVVINCVGIADPAKQKDASSSLFFVTETFDNMIIEYLRNHAETLYLNFSSGAVYGTAFDQPVDIKSSAEIHINAINDKDYYRIAKLNSEAKHRSLSEYNIVDLRVFSYFSRFVNLETKFLMTEIINVLKQNDVFFTNSQDIIRDYIHLSDLFELICCCIKKTYINDVFDVYSKAPVKKFELLTELSIKYGLKYKIQDSFEIINATGIKSVYYSENRHAMSIGYKPKYTSTESIVYEVEKILNIDK